jgi:ubiquinone/menaquinone biosynthesis C-methylase UbiE
VLLPEVRPEVEELEARGIVALEELPAPEANRGAGSRRRRRCSVVEVGCGAVGYLHGSDGAEQERLEAQAWYLGGTDFLPALRPGLRILDVGCGTGAIAREVAGRVAPAEVVGLDRHAAQVRTARHLAAGVGNLRFVCGDATRLALSAASFDGVYGRFVLEHVSDPRAALAEMCRVVRPGGWICVYEWEPGSFVNHPRSEAIDRVWRAIYDLQEALGGDPWIARKLFALLSQVEALEDITVEVRPWTVTARDVDRLRPYVEAARQVLREARDGLRSRGWVTDELLVRAEEDYDRLVGSPEAFVSHGFGRAVARRRR